MIAHGGIGQQIQRMREFNEANPRVLGVFWKDNGAKVQDFDASHLDVVTREGEPL